MLHQLWAVCVCRGVLIEILGSQERRFILLKRSICTIYNCKLYYIITKCRARKVRYVKALELIVMVIHRPYSSKSSLEVFA